MVWLGPRLTANENWGYAPFNKPTVGSSKEGDVSREFAEVLIAVVTAVEAGPLLSISEVGIHTSDGRESVAN